MPCARALADGCRLLNAGGEHRVGLEDVHRVVVQVLPGLVWSVVELAAGDGNVGPVAQPSIPAIVVARQRLCESRDVEGFEVVREVVLGNADYLHGGRPLPTEIGLGPAICGGRVTRERKECCSYGPS